jgi:hypothetical protein
MPLALRAIETDPSCWTCYGTTAALLYERGEVVHAVKAQELVLDLMPEATEETTAHHAYQLLRKYRGAAKTLFSDAVIRTIVKRRVDAYQRCYAEGLARDSRLEGRVVARFVIGRDGAPVDVADDGSNLPDKQVIACVLAEVGRLRFPPREAGPLQAVTHPLVFSPPGAASGDAGQPQPTQASP